VLDELWAALGRDPFVIAAVPGAGERLAEWLLRMRIAECGFIDAWSRQAYTSVAVGIRIKQKRSLSMTVSTETYSADFTNLYFRLPLEAKEVIERAAIVLGQNITDFAVAAILKAANEVLEQHHQRQLSDRDRDLFLALLDADVEPNDALRSAFETHKQLIIPQ
jgi:uncharacterized protein (DUF1778 family)